MKITLKRRFVLQSAHSLPRVPEGHKCGRVHGHTYHVTVELKGVPGPRGWFIDFADIDLAWERVHRRLDHQNLNDQIENPTTENLCAEIYAMLEKDILLGPFLSAVEASENDRSLVRYER